MPAQTQFERKLSVWITDGVIDSSTADRIREYEAQHQKHARWLTILAVALGAVMLAGGILLFVAAHWDQLSPAERFSLVLAMCAAFHAAATFLPEDSDILRITLHGLGTVVLGAGIFLAGQIFNLEEHWPGGVMLWALGALVGTVVLRDWVQPTLLAVLAPSWLFSEWIERSQYRVSSFRLLDLGIAAVALIYFTAVDSADPTPFRKALRWIGGIALFPAYILLFASHEYMWGPYRYGELGYRVFGYVFWLGVGLVLSIALRRRFDLWSVGFLAFTGLLCYLSAFRSMQVLSYLLCAVGSIAMIGWGFSEHRRERINIGVVAFALTVIGFYFSSVMDKLGRSFALMTFGVIFVIGGLLLERTRRRLVARLQEVKP